MSTTPGLRKLLAGLRKPRTSTVKQETLDRIVALRKDGHSKDQISEAVSCGTTTMERAFAEYGGDPIPTDLRYRGRKPPLPVPATQKAAASPSPPQYRAPSGGHHMPPAIRWHQRCYHGRIEQFCTDCRRERA